MVARSDVDWPRTGLPEVDLGSDSEIALTGGGAPSVSVVVPLFNEEATVAALYGEVAATLDAAAIEWELVYVDDGSTDGSYRELVRLHAAYTNVRVVRLRRNFGKAAALAAGFDAA